MGSNTPEGVDIAARRWYIRQHRQTAFYRQIKHQQWSHLLNADPADQLFDELDNSPEPPAPILKRGLNYSHEAMVALIVANPGIHQNEIARQLGYSPSWVSTVIASDAFQAKLAAKCGEIIDPVLRHSAEEQMKGLLWRSMEILREKLNAPSPGDQLVLRTMELSSRALGYGARRDVPAVPTSDAESDLGKLSDNLITLLRRGKASVEQPIEGEIINEETTRSG